MTEPSRYKNYSYSGALANICAGFIAEKRALGYLYNTEAKKLSEFARFSEDFVVPPETLTEELVLAWIAKKANDSDRNWYARYSLIKMFAEYMRRMGYDAYVPDRDDFGKLHRNFIPYIFTHDELRKFFSAVDSMKRLPRSSAPRRHLIMPVLFRLLYCCGLRVSEAIGLQGCDVDLKEGILTIRDSKFGKTRYVPMAPDVTEFCRIYAETRLVAKQGEDWFLAAPDGGCYHPRSIYNVFRDTLWQAGISHGGRGKGPRVHDFRHTFSVHCLQNWVKRGTDPLTALPRLTAYLGHNGFEATEQYLRMTAEVYPEISKLLEEKYGYIIPDGGNAQ